MTIVEKRIVDYFFWIFYNRIVRLNLWLRKKVTLKHYEFQHYLDHLDKRAVSWINSIIMLDRRQSVGDPHQLYLFIYWLALTWKRFAKGSFNTVTLLAENLLICKRFARSLEYCTVKIWLIEGESCSTGQCLHNEWHGRNV